MRKIVEVIREDEEIQEMRRIILEKTGKCSGFHPECHKGLDDYKEYLRRKVEALQKEK